MNRVFGEGSSKKLALQISALQQKVNSIGTGNNGIVSSDFINTASSGEWAIGTQNSGGYALSSGGAKHPGCIGFSSAANANSGASIRIFDNAFTLGGGEVTTFIFKPNSVQTNVIARMGFGDAYVDGWADHADGAYVEVINNVIKGKTANNSVRSNTSSSYTLSTGTWYRVKIELNTDATLVTYTLYSDDSDTILWTDTLDTNIPTSRPTGHGAIAVNTVAGYYNTIWIIDYADVHNSKARKTSSSSNADSIDIQSLLLNESFISGINGIISEYIIANSTTID